MALGLSARKASLCVDWYPEPQSSRSNARFSSAQVHSTLRTLIDEALPNIRSILSLLCLLLIQLSQKQTEQLRL
ncbi:hypothetical protein D3C77_726150 [compost metagenome]